MRFTSETKKNKKELKCFHKAKRWWPLLTIAIAVFSLLFIFNLTQNINHKPVPQNQRAGKTSQEFPVRLVIPTINVNANIQRVGIAPNGEMDVPSNTFDVGWFGLGAFPGEMGSAVIGGHFDGQDDKGGVFTDLYKLKEGDKLYVEDNKGRSSTFVVRKISTYSPGYAYDVFSPSDSAHLNLVTCGGMWNGNEKTYSERLVVFADIVR